MRKIGTPLGETEFLRGLSEERQHTGGNERMTNPSSMRTVKDFGEEVPHQCEFAQPLSLCPNTLCMSS